MEANESYIKDNLQKARDITFTLNERREHMPCRGFAVLDRQKQI